VEIGAWLELPVGVRRKAPHVKPTRWRGKANWNAINQALTLGYSPITGSAFPENFDFYWPPPPPLYDPKAARKLLVEAGYSNGFDAGYYHCDIFYANVGPFLAT
jgi:ABC-type transport system substrate-binding protein